MTNLIDRLMAYRYRGWIFALLGLVVLLVSAFTTNAIMTWRKPASENNGKSPSSNAEASAPLPDRISVLLIGVGSRNFSGPTDSLLLVSFDPKANKAYAVSIPRDTFGQIPGRGWDKVNHAYSLAPQDRKAETTVETISGLLGLPIENYVVMHMQGFKEAVDLLGGVDIDVEKDMRYSDPRDTPPLHINLKKGPQRLDGQQALHYVRFRRDSEGDFGRMRRQQQVLSALLKEALKIKQMPKIRQLVNSVKENVDTNLATGQILRLAQAARKLDPENLTGTTVEGRNRMLGGVYYLEVDLVALRTAAYEAMYGRQPGPAFIREAQADAQHIRNAIEARLAKEAPPPPKHEPKDEDEKDSSQAGEDPRPEDETEGQDNENGEKDQSQPDGDLPPADEGDPTGEGHGNDDEPDAQPDDGTNEPGNGPGETGPDEAGPEDDPGTGAGAGADEEPAGLPSEPDQPPANGSHEEEVGAVQPEP